MIRKFYVIIMLLCLAGIANSADYEDHHRVWSDSWAIGTGTSNHLWSDGDNWYRPSNDNENDIPMCLTDVRIGLGEGSFSYPQPLADNWEDMVDPTCNSPESAALIHVCSPDTSDVNDPNDHHRLWITSGADLHVYGPFKINGYNGQGTVNMDGGLLTVEESMYLADNEATGILNMTGGTVLVQSNFYCPSASASATNDAHLNLDSGLFLVEEDFSIINSNNCSGEIDIAGGTLKIKGDKVTLTEGYADDGYIKSHGVTDGSLISGNLRAFLHVDYNARTAGYTTLTAVTIADNRAWKPIPNPITDVSQKPLNQILTWASGEGASSHDVYIGTDYTTVNNATPASDEFVTNTTSNSYDKPTGYLPGVTYYWRIDEVGSSTIKGYVWNFTVDNCQAYDEEPAEGDCVNSDPNLKWTSSSYARSHDIYFGTSHASVNTAARLAGDIDGDTLVDGYDLNTICGNWLGENFIAHEPNLANYRNFDENTGTTAADSAGSNDGTLQGSAGWTTGQINSCINLNGSGDSVEIPDSTLSGSWTMMLWVNTDTNNVGTYDGAKVLGDGSTGTCYLAVIDGYGIYYRNSVSGPSFYDVKDFYNVWRHIAIVSDGSHIECFVDGTSLSKKGVSSSDFDLNAIGAGGASNHNFDGQLDEIMIFDYALSAYEIADYYDAMSAGHLPLGDGDLNNDSKINLLDYAVVADDWHVPADEPYKGNYTVNNYPCSGLDVGETYYWRIDEVGSKGTVKGDIWEFDVSICWKYIIVGDSRGSNDGINAAILSEIVAEIVAQEVEFVLFPGDLVSGYNSQSALQSQLMVWRNAMQPVYDAGIGVYPVRGNHDIGNPAGTTAWNNVFSGAYALPANGPSGELNLTYSVEHKNLLVLALDQYITSHRVNQTWVNGKLSANTKTHIVALGHEPAFKLDHSDCLDDYPTNRDAFWTSLVDAGCQIYACGHDHFYNHAVVRDSDAADDVSQYVVGTAGAPIYSWSLPYDGDNSGNRIVQYQHAATYGYILVEVTDTEMNTTWYGKNSTTGLYEPTIDAEDPNDPNDPLFRFGVVADAQYADVNPWNNRYYRESLWKLQDAVDDFNSTSNMSFAIQVGDFVDRYEASYTPMLAIYNQLTMPKYHVIGNHDYPDGMTTAQVMAKLGMTADYYDFTYSGWRFIVLNTNEIGTFSTPSGSPERAAAQRMLDEVESAGALQAKEWNSALSKTQKAWLKTKLAAAETADEKVVIFGHHPLYPEGSSLRTWDNIELIDIIESYDCVVAYMNGHQHEGGYGVKNGVHYLTVHGMVVSEFTNAYAVIEVYDDHLVVVGTGHEPSRALVFPTD